MISGTTKKYIQTRIAFTTKATRKAAMIGRIGAGSFFASVPSCQSTTACTAR
jgi:hypothetical protein